MSRLDKELAIDQIKDSLYAFLSSRILPSPSKGDQAHIRRLQIAKDVFNCWTSFGSLQAGLAERFVDGSIEGMEEFVGSPIPPKGASCDTESEPQVSTVDVRHAQQLSYQNFVEEYMMTNRPVLVKDIGQGWPASQDWLDEGGKVDPDAMNKLFHNARITATIIDGKRISFDGGRRVEMSFHEFIQHWKADTGDERLYLKDWHMVNEFPQYKAYDCPIYFRDDWLNDYFDMRQDCASQDCTEGTGISVETSDYRFVYLGCKGTGTPIHADVLRSYSWSANLAGKKKWKLLAPQYTPLLMDRFGREMAASFDLPHAEFQFPNLSQAASLAIELEQGVNEALFVPSGWHHSVENVEDTLSINHNWLNGFNIHWSWDLLQQEHAAATAAIEDCRQLCDPAEFEDLVQRNLEANCSFNYRSMTHFIGTITTRQLGRLRGSAARASIQNIDCFALQRCILVLHELQDKLQGVVSSADPEVVEDLQNVSDTAAGLCDLSALQGRLPLMQPQGAPAAAASVSISLFYRFAFLGSMAAKFFIQADNDNGWLRSTPPGRPA